MTKLSVLCWQEIPSVVEAGARRSKHKIELSLRFQELIDLIAMKRGLDGSDDYLAQWRKESRPESESDPEQAAEDLAKEIEANYDKIRAEALAKS